MDLLPARSSPLGATPTPRGVNFSIYSRTATGMDLLLFDDVDDPAPSRVIHLDPLENRTFHYWHVHVANLQPGQLYGWCAHGPSAPEKGLRFDPDKLLLDPYARVVAIPAAYNRERARRPGKTIATGMRSVVADRRGYDWQGDRPLLRPFSDTVIYEMHLAGFTRHPSSGISREKRGTFAGLVDKIPYLVDLGITAVELLPVFQFDPQDAPPGLTNYWGYCPVSFFAPHAPYASGRDVLAPQVEFRDMVKALHRAGIEVILDVVFNHTAEGDERGPTSVFRGIDNPSYYLLDPDDPARYSDFTGTGNTLRANGSVVRRMILDSLRYWVEEMHVDGFRFDLASILARDSSGEPTNDPPVLWDIETDPVLAGTKLIAEAWDAGGLYLVGAFLGDRWTEWNGVFRDDVRRFVRGDPGTVSLIPKRLLGSPDLYLHEKREPEQSINFVTCHDGFTLNDLVSYKTKHNHDNHEGERDGSNHNHSCNHGVEGPTDDPEIDLVRNRQVKNLLALTLMSLGTPMLLMGDEVRRSQAGNNNAYCQDNEISWFNWSLLHRHADVHRFVKRMIDLRLRPDNLATPLGTTLETILRTARIQWHGVSTDRPDWSDEARTLALTVRFSAHRLGHLMLNTSKTAQIFELPHSPPKNGVWWRVVDTALPPPHDIVDPGEESVVEGDSYQTAPQSVVLLIAPTR